MGVYIGVDFHARKQTISYLTTEDGEIRRRELDHEKDDVGGFYGQFAGQEVVVGLGRAQNGKITPSGYRRMKEQHRFASTLKSQNLLGFSSYRLQKTRSGKSVNSYRPWLVLRTAINFVFPVSYL